VLANVSTVSPSTVRRLADAGPPGAVLDTPVLGAPAAIGRGEGTFLVGGPAETVAGVRWMFSELAGGHVHCGPVGAGSVMKLVSNLQLMVGVVALAEGIATARAHGIGDELIRTVLSESRAVSPASRARLDSLLDPAHPGWFPPELARKDVRLAVALADEGGIGVRLGPAADALLSAVVEAGPIWSDFTAVIEALAPLRAR
jgi:3-hydroxyisobutyrate dehydrogenase-like beta-hydroxyacid dehydrogenase